MQQEEDDEIDAIPLYLDQQNIMTIWNRIKNLFSKPEQPLTAFSDTAMPQMAGARLNEAQMVGLMERIEKTLENAYSCEEAFDLLDEYVELVADDKEARQLMPLVKNHIDMCPDCRDQFEILLHILKTADSE